MSGTNAGIPLSFQPTQNIGPNFGAAIQNANDLMGFQQAQKQVEQQNKLRDILGAKDAIDSKTGIPTPETFSKVYAADPMTGMKLQQNSLAMAQHTMQMNAIKSKTNYEQASYLNDLFGTVVAQRDKDGDPGSGLTPQQADAKAQESWTKTLERANTEGVASPEALKNIPTKFDYSDAKNRAMLSQQYIHMQDEERRDKAEKRQEQAAQQRFDIQQKQFDRQTKADQNRAVTLERDPNTGREIAVRPNAPPGEQRTYTDTGEEVPTSVVANPIKSAGSAATQDQQRIANVTRFQYEKELGHAIQTPEEQAALDRRILDAENQQAGDKAGAVAKAKQEITENSGVPSNPDQEAARAAQLSTGQPMTAVIPGWGPASRAAQKKAYGEAIQLIQQQTGMNATDAGIELANRGIEYAGGKRAVGQVSTMLAMTRPAVQQLEYNINAVKKELKDLPSTNLSPLINAIIRQEESWTGDPRLAPLYYNMYGVATESARLMSGGQASTAQLHAGAAAEAQRWANSNMTPASFDALAGPVLDEGRARIKSFEDGLKQTRIGPQPTSGNTAPVTGGGTGGGQQHPPPTPGNIKWLKANPTKAADWDKSYPDYPSSKYLGGGTPTSSAQTPESTTSPAATTSSAGPPQPTHPAGPTTQEATGAAPMRPAGVAPGSQWSPSRRLWRDAYGNFYDAEGNPAGR